LAAAKAKNLEGDGNGALDLENADNMSGTSEKKADDGGDNE
jgi:hypothetical protein